MKKLTRFFKGRIIENILDVGTGTGNFTASFYNLTWFAEQRIRWEIN